MSKGKRKHAHFDNVALIRQVFDKGATAGKVFSAKACCVWIVLALREEGYGPQRLQRVLGNVLKYVKATTDGSIDIDEQREHIRRTTGINIKYDSADTILYEIDADFADEHDLDFMEE